MPSLSYHSGARGLLGFLKSVTGSDGVVRTGVVPAAALVDSSGNDISGSTVQLATNATISATSGTAPITGVQGGVYTFDAQFTGTSLRLQSLGSDGTTWRDVLTVTTSGTYAGEVRIGRNATLRLYNPNGTSDTAVYASLS